MSSEPTYPACLVGIANRLWQVRRESYDVVRRLVEGEIAA